jgi:4-alpha-glucanotransferase
MSVEFNAFCSDNELWLDDFALYRSIKVQQDHKPWYEWPAKFKHRDQRIIGISADQLRDQIQAEKFYQFLFFRQWSAVKRHARRNGVKLIGDIPIFVALDSADVWTRQEQFKLNADGTAKVVAGVPPDFFSKTGQLWGNPIYDWDAMRSDDFRWWVSRFRFAFTTVDIVRIDHFRGFAASWEVPGSDETAEKGTWVGVPGRELFEQLSDELGELAMIAEDLGEITPEVVLLRDDLGFPGMKVLQFAFGSDAGNEHLPHNYVQNRVVYTATHDNDTTVGWWNSRPEADSTERTFCLSYLNTGRDPLGHSPRSMGVRSRHCHRSGTGHTRSGFRGTDEPARNRLRKLVVANGSLKRLRELTELYGRSRAIE